MESLNQTLFLLLNAPAQPAPGMLAFATVLAQDFIWLVPVLLGAIWLRGSERARAAALAAACAGLLGLTFNQAIGLVWQHPRPFMIGLGHSFLAHAADSSFPSDHLTLITGVAFGLYASGMRRTGAALAQLGIPAAWARIYLGVHFPLDMLGAAGVGLLSSLLVTRPLHRLLPALYALAMKIHRRLFNRLILRGWVRA